MCQNTSPPRATCWTGHPECLKISLRTIMKFQKIAIASLVVMILSQPIADGKVVYVNAAAASGGNGTSWPTACRFLQDALDLTDAGDEVWVAAGTYYPDDGASVTTGDRAASFTLKQDVQVYGGFAGGEAAIEQRNPVTNATTLSGEIWTESIYWSLHVVTLSGNATLNCINVVKGNANGDANPFNRGGGIYAPSVGEVAINGCTFTDNRAAYGGAIYSLSSVKVNHSVFVANQTASTTPRGGAIYVAGSASAPVWLAARNCAFSGNIASIPSGGGGAIASGTYASISADSCSFSNNSASYGGAIFASSTVSSFSTNLTNCLFSNNQANTTIYNESKGGAIYLYNHQITAENCDFSGNKVSSADCSGGAIYLSNSIVSAFKFVKCTFSNNQSAIPPPPPNSGNTVYGGAIYFDLWKQGETRGVLADCEFSNNSSYGIYGASVGGAICLGGGQGCRPTIEMNNCSFKGNSASSERSTYCPGGVMHTNMETLILATNCLFSGNSASLGGAFHLGSQSSIIATTNCTFVNNVATGTGNKGGSIFSAGRVKIFNNLLWHSLAQPQSNLIYITSTGSLRNADVDFPSPLNQAVNLIKGGMSAITAETGAVVSLGDTAVKILSADPLFVDAANPAGADGIWGTPDDGLRLQATSPAIDLGLAMFLPVDAYDLDNDGNLTESIPVDLAGYDRIQRAALDLGAYEVGDSFQPIGILMQPLDLTLLKYLEATFTVTASGFGLRYQWYRGESGDTSQPITDATGNSYTSPELETAASYWVRVRNALGFVDSRSATAAVVPVVITVQPASTVAAIGATAALSVAASGKGLTYQWYQGGSGDTSHPMEGANQSLITTPGLAETSSFWVRVTSVYGTLDSDTATVTVIADPVAAALNKESSLVFTAGGNAAWFAQSATTHDGFAAAQSGVITHNQSTSVETSVAGPGTISFWWRVSSQSGGDYLRFYINGAEQSGSISGTTGTWAQKTFTVAAAGAYTFKWSYTKNSSTSSGSDCGWVDEVVWNPKLITNQPTNLNILRGMSAGMGVTASGTNLSYQWFAGESGTTTSPVTGATGPNLTTPALDGTTQYWVSVGNGVGFESSTTATVTVHPPDPIIANALNSGNIVSYFTWGAMPWIVQSITTHDGVSAMQSGAISHSQASVLEGVVDGNGTLSFWWKVSSELGYDFLRFYIDDVEQGSLSGETAWQQATFNLPGAGVHKLKWVYVKDESKTSGSDGAWLDEVSWQAAGSATTYQMWVTEHDLTGVHALETANPAGDGVSNLVKYALGLNPHVAATAPTDGTLPGLPLMERVGGSMRFTFIKDTAKADISYTVESCEDLATWQSVTTGVLETPLTGTRVRVEAAIPIIGRRFVRLNVSK